MPFNPGEILEKRYIVEEVLGEGGMGSVYLASDNRIPGKKWAVKEMYDFGDEETVKLVEDTFKKEASILATLDHPFLPRITDFFVRNNKKYLVMDYIDGITLEKKVSTEGPLDIETLFKVTMELTEVLEYIHNENPPVIFRDLKPSNIMLTVDFEIRLIDFGIARIFTAGKSKDTTVLGTPGYAAPEQYGSGQTDRRTDIYGLGATLYFAATGSDPADDPFNFDDPKKLNPKISDRLSRAILKCVQLKPEERFQSVAEFRQYLFSSESITGKISADAEGSHTGPAVENGAGIILEPEELDFGHIQKGKKRKRKFTIKGKVSNVHIEKDRPWIRVHPRLVDGVNPEVGVTVYTSSLNHGGSYDGLVSVAGERLNMKVPVKIKVDPKHLNCLSYVLFFVFTMISLLPFLNFLGLVLNLAAFFSVAKGERNSVKIFVYVTIFANIIWTIILGVAMFAGQIEPYINQLLNQ